MDNCVSVVSFITDNPYVNYPLTKHITVKTSFNVLSKVT